jgi:hypothetical protein
MSSSPRPWPCAELAAVPVNDVAARGRAPTDALRSSQRVTLTHRVIVSPNCWLAASAVEETDDRRTPGSILRQRAKHREKLLASCPQRPCQRSLHSGDTRDFRCTHRVLEVPPRPCRAPADSARFFADRKGKTFWADVDDAACRGLTLGATRTVHISLPHRRRLPRDPRGHMSSLRTDYETFDARHDESEQT